MRSIAEFAKTTLVGGVLVLLPIYLSILLLLKAISGLMGLVSPITEGLPEALPFREVIAILVLIVACFTCGIAVRTGPGLRAKNAIERSVLEKIPGYALIRGLAGKIVGAPTSSPSRWYWPKSRMPSCQHSSSRIAATVNARFSCPPFPACGGSDLHHSQRTRPSSRRAIHAGVQRDHEVRVGFEGAVGWHEAVSVSVVI